MPFVPDLAAETPLWLALLTVGVNASVGALRASVDDERHWDIVGLTTFGALMGLGGGVLVSVLKDEVPGILLTSAPNALVALLVSGVYAAVGAHYAA